MSRSFSDYYHGDVGKYLAFTIPRGQRVLYFGHHRVDNLRALQPSRGVFAHPGYVEVDDAEFETRTGLTTQGIDGPFDCVVLDGVLGGCTDIGVFLGELDRICSPDTRVIVVNHRYLWAPLLRLAERLGLKSPGGLENMLAWADIMNYMTASGFQLVTSRSSMLCPAFLLGIGPVVNMIGKCVPLFDWAKINQFSVYRLVPNESPDERPGLTVCLTCRNEKNCIEPLVKEIPRITDEQEILFVEGHSTDGTREEIERVIQAYPDKNIRVIGQPGKGQGDAIREGFANAKGDIVILLEADLTSPPENIRYVYHCLRKNGAEFLEGSRLVYNPLSYGVMPFVNQAGNWAFALFFRWLFEQHMTDVLSGIKAIHKKNFMKILDGWGRLGIEDPFGDFELLFGAVRLGLKVGELPIHYRKRYYGSTKTRAFYHGWMLLRMSVIAFFMFRR